MSGVPRICLTQPSIRATIPGSLKKAVDLDMVLVVLSTFANTS